MFDDSNIIVGLEIGTSKICAVVGEQNADGTLNIVGLGQSPARGMRKGEIVDAGAAEECVRNAIVEAEQMADVEIRAVYLGVTGGHIRGFNNRGVHPVVSADARDELDMTNRACRFAYIEGFAGVGERVLVVAGVPFGTPGSTNTLRIAVVAADGGAG